MTPTPLDIEERSDRRVGDAQSLGRSIGIALAVVSLASSLFIAGYNWRSVAIVELNQENFVRKDVQGERFRNVEDRLGDISRQVEELRNEMRARDRRKE